MKIQVSGTNIHEITYQKMYWSSPSSLDVKLIKSTDVIPMSNAIIKLSSPRALLTRLSLMIIVHPRCSNSVITFFPAMR